MAHHREVVNADGAPAPVGPYSHAAKAGGLLFCSGQVALDPSSGELVGDTAAEQAQQCLVNLQAVCEAAGAWLHDAVRVTVWLTDMDDFAAVNEQAGLAAQRVETDEALQFLADVFWFSMEFGVVWEDGELKTYRTAVVYLDPPADLQAAWEEAPVILDVGGRTDGYIIPPSGGGGLKFGSGLHKVRTSDADWNRQPVEGEGIAIRDLFAPPMARIGDYRVKDVVTCAYTFTADERFTAAEFGKCLVVSACSGHGYKFGASVGINVAKAVEDGDAERLRMWLRAELV